MPHPVLLRPLQNVHHSSDDARKQKDKNLIKEQGQENGLDV